MAKLLGANRFDFTHINIIPMAVNSKIFRQLLKVIISKKEEMYGRYRYGFDGT